VKIEVNIITSSFYVLQYVQLKSVTNYMTQIIIQFISNYRTAAFICVNFTAMFFNVYDFSLFVVQFLSIHRILKHTLMLHLYLFIAVNIIHLISCS